MHNPCLRPTFTLAVALTVTLTVALTASALAAYSQNTQPLPDSPAPAAAPAQPAAAPAPAQPAAAQPSAAAQPAAPQPLGPLTVLENTLLRVQTLASIDSRHVRDGQPVDFIVVQDVLVNYALAIPRGAIVHGKVVSLHKSGRLAGTPSLTFQLVSLDVLGETYPLDSHLFRVTGTSKADTTRRDALVGAYIGAAAGVATIAESSGGTAGSKAAAVATDSAIGAGVGTLASGASRGPDIWIPAEAQIDFTLAVPVTVNPITALEARRLREGLDTGGPSLYVRGETP